MAFAVLRTGDPDLDRVQQAVKAEFDALAAQDDHELSVVSVAAPYKVLGTEDIIGVTTGSPTITLQPARLQKRKLTVTSQGGTATVQTADSKFSVALGPRETKTLVSNGTTYWVL